MLREEASNRKKTEWLKEELGKARKQIMSMKLRNAEFKKKDTENKRRITSFQR
jgi:hypothetical protein